MDAGYQIKFTQVRVQRCSELDEWASYEESSKLYCREHVDKLKDGVRNGLS